MRNNPQAIIDLLGLLPLVFPISGMTLVRPDDEPIIRPRLATEAILHWERYDVAGEERLLEDYDRAMVQTGIYAGRQVGGPGPPGEVEDYGWREHSARRVSQPGRKRDSETCWRARDVD